MTPEQQVLLAEIRNVFGNKKFDTMSVLCAVHRSSVEKRPELQQPLKV
jgi:hypothetical protein